MASLFMSSCKVVIFLVIFSSLQFYIATSTEFVVGGDDGWVMPKSKKDNQLYNQWASKNRFKIDDTVHFKYKKDSVMVVTEEEYEKCRSSHPLFFSNNDDSVFKLDRPGLFYFISGVAGHCERGQKMIIKVLEPEIPPQSANQNSTTDPTKSKSGALEMAPAASSTIMVLTMTILGVIFI